MKIATRGARFWGGQLDRIERGFLELGHELTPHLHEAQLVYGQNPWYDEIVMDRKAGQIRGKVLMNVLDLAPHLGAEFPLMKLREQLHHADAVTTISDTVAGDLTARAGFNSTVIYNPIKDVVRTGVKKHPYRAMFVGRVADRNKRALLGVQALQILGFQASEIVTVGGDAPFYGAEYWGVATDEALNDLYNSVDYVMMPSRHEGMGLPALEAFAAGAIPVICNDLSTRWEFFRDIPEYDQVNPDPVSIARFIAQFEQDNDRKTEFKARLHRHYLTHWQHKLSGRGVAAAILKVYENL